MFRKLLSGAVLVAFAMMAPQAMAADKPKKPAMQVKSELYVTAKETWELMQSNERAILVDVRDPIEIMFTGYTDEIDIHVPFRLSDRTEKHPKKPVYAMNINQQFVKEMTEKLAELGVQKDDPIIFMCRSGGTRSAPSANVMFDEGWTQTYTMVDGFEGAKSKAEETKGARIVNGWKNSGLPWGYDLNFEKMYLADK